MTVDERYRLSTYKEISVFSENSSKKIYIVMDEANNNLYIKKVLSGTDYFNFYTRFSSLKHKNLIEIHDVICCDDATHVFEEYVNGQTLQAVLENEGFLPESRVIDYTLQVCDALIYLHSQNPPIIHRDIKPENIMLSADHVIKLVDFDIAREFKQSAARDTTFMGTKEYAAPEQYGYKQTDGRTDIYAIGVLLHEMLTGKLPQNNITYKGALRKIIEKCLRLEPEQRYQSVSALKRALAGTKVSRYKKIGIYALPGLAVIVAIAMLFPKIADYGYSQSDAPPSSTQAITGQAADDEDFPSSDTLSSTQAPPDQNADDEDAPEPDATASPQPDTDQNADNEDNQPTNEPLNTGDEDLPVSDVPVSPQPDTEHSTVDPKYAEFIKTFSSQTLIGEKFADIVVPFLKVEDYSEKPAIILEQKGINNYVRSITGNSYDAVAGAFQEFDDSFWEAFYDPDINLLGMAMCNYVDGSKHDRLLIEVGTNHMNITYHDKDKEATYYFTTDADKGLLSDNAFDWIKHYPSMFESPIVFDEPPIGDVTGTYYLGNQRRIEIFEEEGEMKFSYTDIRISKDAEPWIVTPIQKYDDNHYWLKTYTGWNDKEMLFFNFSKKHLTLTNMLQDSDDVIYRIAGSEYPKAFDPKGIYEKK